MVFPRVQVKATLCAALCVLCVLQGVNADDASAASGSSLMSAQASVPVVCSLTVSEGDAAFGINIETDASCANGGVGCIDNVCRFCKTTENPQSSHFQPCGSVAPTSVSDSCAASQGDIAVGVTALADASCANGGLGCYNAHCRFCKFRSTAQSAHLLSCSDFGYAPQSQSSGGSVASPVPDSVVCTQTVSAGDAAVGIAFASDPTCVQGGLGCYGAVCRFCKVTSTPQSAHLFPCSSFAKASAGSSFGQPLDLPSSDGSTWTSIAPSSSDVVTDTPSSGAPSSSDGNAALSGSSGGDTLAPFEPATNSPPSFPSSTDPTTDTPSSSVATDSSTSTDVTYTSGTTGSLTDGPFGTGVIDSPASSDMTYTPAATDPLNDASSSTGVTDTSASIDVTNTPSATDTSTNASSGSVVTDASSSTAAINASGVTDPSTDAPSGASVTDTPSNTDTTNTPVVTLITGVTDTSSAIDQSKSAASTNSDTTGTPISMEPSTDAPSLSSSTPDTNDPTQSTTVPPASQSSSESSAPSSVDADSPVPASSEFACPEVSAGDAAVGIQLITDPSCAEGGLGCYDNSCRFCKFRTTGQSNHLLSCSDFGFAFGTQSTSGSKASTPIPTGEASVCTETVSEGDAAVGIAFETDLTCVQGGLGCYGAVCRFCQVLSTPQSAHLYPCSTFAPSTDGDSFGQTFELPSSDEGSTWTSIAPSSSSDGTEVLSSDESSTDSSLVNDATTAPPDLMTQAPSNTATITDVPASSEPVTDNSATDAPTMNASSGSEMAETAAPAEPSTSVPASSDSLNTLAPVDPSTNAPNDNAPSASADATSSPDVSEPSTNTPLDTGSADTPASTDPTSTPDVTEPSTGAPSGTGIADTPASTDATSTPDVTEPSTNAPSGFSSASTDATSTPDVTEPSTNVPSGTGISDTPASADTSSTPDVTEPLTNAPSGTGVADTPANTDQTNTLKPSTDASSSIVVTDTPGVIGQSTSPVSANTDTTETPTSAGPPTEAPPLGTDALDITAPSQPTTAAPTSQPSSESPVPSNSVSSVPPLSESVCPAVSSGDTAVGIQLINDPTCVNGGLGCYANACRFCKIRTTTHSAHLFSCSQFGITFGSASNAGPVTGTPVPTATSNVCTESVSAGDSTAGIAFVTDSTCAQGGLGCYGTICRFCRVTLTPQSAHLLNCSEFTIQAPAPTTSPSATTIAPAPTTASPTCSVSSGDAAVGISAEADAACANGGLGCYTTACRFCKVRSTPQSQHLMNCTSLTTSTVSTMKAAAVSNGAESSGLDKLMNNGTCKWLITAAAGFGVAAMVAMMAFAVKTSIRQLSSNHPAQNTANEENPFVTSAESTTDMASTDDSSVLDEV